MVYVLLDGCWTAFLSFPPLFHTRPPSAQRLAVRWVYVEKGFLFPPHKRFPGCRLRTDYGRAEARFSVREYSQQGDVPAVSAG